MEAASDTLENIPLIDGTSQEIRANHSIPSDEIRDKSNENNDKTETDLKKTSLGQNSTASLFNETDNAIKQDSENIIQTDVKTNTTEQDSADDIGQKIQDPDSRKEDDNDGKDTIGGDEEQNDSLSSGNVSKLHNKKEISTQDEPEQNITKQLPEPDDSNLELHDTNLEHDDFSKLLEFDSKDDHEIFNSKEILEHAISSVDEQNIALNKETDDLIRETTEDIPSLPHFSSPSLSSIKEEPSETNISTKTKIKKENIAHSEAEENNVHNTELPKTFEITNPKIDENTPASIIFEKNNLLYPKRKNSLTPVMFQPHELVSTNPNTTVNSASSTRPTSGQGNWDPSNNQKPVALKSPSIDQQSAFPTNEQPTIFAYARLDFQSFTFYVQTLHAIIGRRSENDFTHKVDVNLGPSKSISRRHAQIFYNFGTGRFELSIIGKNGAFVDDVFVERGNTVPLKNKTKIQIGQIPFQFILPEQEKGQSSASPETFEPADIDIDDAHAMENQSGDEDVKIPTLSKKAGKLPPIPKRKLDKSTVKKEKKPTKQPKKVYTIDEIPVEYRTKPTFSYSAILTTCIRKYSSEKGMSLSEIYGGIRELFPYYKYCPDGWQSSVRHNLSLNKSFRKVSKEGKGWLWGLDEDYIAEREKQKKKQAEVAAAKAEAAQLRLEQQQSQKTKKSTTFNPSRKSNAGSNQSISQTLAANRATTKKPS